MRSCFSIALTSTLLLSAAGACNASPEPTPKELQKLLSTYGIAANAARTGGCMHIETFDEKTNRVTYTDEKGERHQVRPSPDTPQGKMHIEAARTYEHVCRFRIQDKNRNVYTIGKYRIGGELAILLVQPQ